MKNPPTVRSGAAALALALIASTVLYGGAFANRWTVTVRVAMSLGTALFSLLWMIALTCCIIAVHAFIELINSPNPGRAIIDARVSGELSLFSDAYLNERGKLARARLFRAIRWFAGSFVFGIFVIGAMFFVFRIAQ